MLHDARESLPTSISHNFATTYLTGAGLVALLYDHLLTFDDEVRYIWQAPSTPPKFFFLFVRYMVPMTLLTHTHYLSGLSRVQLSDTFCRTWLSIALVIGSLSIAISNFLILLRLWILWNRNRRYMVWTLLCFVITQCAVIACTTITIVDLMGSLRYNSAFRLCVITHRGSIAVYWAPGMFFELVVFATTCYNVLSRPRTHLSPMIKSLYRDGFNYFIILFGLRVANLALTIAAPLSLIYLGVFVIWCATTITLSRFIFKVRRLAVEEANEILIKPRVRTSMTRVVVQ